MKKEKNDNEIYKLNLINVNGFGNVYVNSMFVFRNYKSYEYYLCTGIIIIF